MKVNRKAHLKPMSKDNPLIVGIIIASVLIILSLPYTVSTYVYNYNIRVKDVNKYRLALGSPYADARQVAALYLGIFGEEAEEAVPDLFIRLDDESRVVRMAAVEAIYKIGLNDETIGLATRWLDADDVEVRRFIIYSIDGYGKDYNNLKKELVKRLFDEAQEIRERAYEMVIRMYNKKEIANELLSILDGLDINRKIKAIEMIDEFDGTDQETILKLEAYGKKSGDKEIIQIIEDIKDKRNIGKQN